MLNVVQYQVAGLIMALAASLVCGHLGCDKKQETQSEEKAPADKQKLAKKETTPTKESKTEAPIKFTEKEFNEFAQMKIEGFNTLPHSKGSAMNAMLYLEGIKENDKGVFPSAMVSIMGCIGCAQQKMDKEVWRGRKDNLMMMLPSTHKNNPDLVFDIDEMDIDGTKVITQYGLSFVKTENSKASMHELDIFYNNGVNMMNIKVSGKHKQFKMAESLDELKTEFTRAEMEAAAKSVFKALNAKF